MNLGVTNLFFELALIFLPGFVWMKIHKKYGANGEATQFDLILDVFLFGVVSYAILLLIYRCFGIKMHLFSMTSDDKRLVPQDIFPEIFYAVIISVFAAVINLYIVNYKFFTRSIQFIKATKTYGDEDVWDFVFNSSSNSVNYIHFRDFEKQVVYAGDVDIFSESGSIRELMLKDVTVYDFDGNEMYQVPRLYLARERENLHIEFPLAQ